MKYFTLVSFFLSSISFSQGALKWSDIKCYTVDKYGNETIVDCDDVKWSSTHVSTPVFTGNIDSLCWEMEKRFVETLNDWRREHGIDELEYDHDMHAMLTLPHNEWQVSVGYISHGKGSNSLKSRSARTNIMSVGECCAYNHRSDWGEMSQFFLQYRDSPPHWKILIDKKYNYISASVMYDQETNIYYSVVNVRG
jgi:uncharacterized protein YkwD